MLHQPETDANLAITVAVLRERTEVMGREMRELKDALREQVTELRAGQKAISDKLDTMQTTMSEARGGWRTLMLLGGASGSLGAAASWAIAHFGKGS